MRILLVGKKFYPHIGGIQTYFFNISQEFIKLGHKVDVVSCKEGENLESEEEYKGIKIHRYDMPILKKSEVWKWPQAHQETIYDFMKNLGEYDLIICRFPLFLKPCLKLFKDKIVYIAPSLYSHFSSILEEKFEDQKRVFEFISKEEKKYLKEVKVVVLSKFVKKNMEKLGIGNIRVIKPGVSLEKINENRDKIVLYVGRLTQEKNPESAIRVSKEIKGKMVLVGGGDNLEELKKYNMEQRGKVEFKGWMENPRKIMKKSKIFILPSKYEAFGLVLLEAFACGLPIVAFKPSKEILSASDEIIDNGRTGFLVKDEEEMKEKINLLLEDKDLWKKMSKNVRKEAEKYSWEKTAKEILKFVKS